MQNKKNGFQFKQFYVAQDRCAMKVGTDGVLLGAWAPVEDKKRILDLGTGTGLVALMLAQRSLPDCQIIALEIDSEAYSQAKENVQHSPWTTRIQVRQQDVLEFCEQDWAEKEKFDLIVSNPPYFQQGVNCGSAQRELARYRQSSHFAWLCAAANCLAEKGTITFILPYTESEILLKQTALNMLSKPLYCTSRCEIISKVGKAAQRLLLSFEFEQKPLLQQSLLIYDEQNQYSAEFKHLLHEFYLKF